MYEYLDNEYEQPLNKKYPDKQGEIADNLKKQAEIIDHDMSVFTRLTKWYYGTDTDEKDYSEYTWEETEIDNAHVYTLIKYHNKDMIVQVGTGAFNTTVFTRRNIPALKWFSYGPLPLFVVTSWAEQEHKENNPRKFLNEHTIIYSPKWGQAEFRTSKQREQSINYGNSNGIMNYDDALLALQNAHIHKIFYNDTLFEKFASKIKELKKYDLKQFKVRSTLKEEFFKQDEKKRLLYHAILECFAHISDNDYEKMYELIQSFDSIKGIFIKQK